ncbi:N-acyl-D-amino-acid deacylase family protein [Flavihumibacter fluvii]|uniref:N-acyl-D-amino-acid deacylase family protein n=1 Tax=Flavihumibacter fluvii TaxID=2838157 RepID=UPI001BDF5D06|nr:D-aminoacylase [Flavihumibacter fluvii]ULQ53109.1 D-aminoacylase [Flavihumibacter fluvii]
MKWLFLLLISTTTSAQEFDLVILNGKIIDGTGNSWYYGDIGIRDGKIAAIGQLGTANTLKSISAKGMVVTPGFIDVHAHIESSIFQKPSADNFIFDGVTTVVTGNCGSSFQSGIGEFLRKVDSTGTAINIATLVGHNTIREEVMQRAQRDPNESEQQLMEALVTKAMAEGATGMSTGLIYIPGTYAKTREIIGLARIVKANQGIYASHMRNEGNEIDAAIKETIEIGRATGIPVEISHFKLSGQRNWGGSNRTLGLIMAARKEGLDVTIDQYPYTASSTNLHVLLPSWVLAGGTDSMNYRLTNSAVFNSIRQEMLTKAKTDKRKNYAYAVVANCPGDSSLNGKSISDITKTNGRKPNIKNDIETVKQIILKGGAQMIYHSMNEEDVRNIMRYPFNMIASDAGVVYLPKSVPHPRAYGTNARVLAQYVRETNTISLEEAIRRMSSLPAQKFKFQSKGLLKPGMDADIVIFDPLTVRDNSTFDLPHQFSSGFRYVIVNGELTLENNTLTGARAGKALYGLAIPGKIP